MIAGTHHEHWDGSGYPAGLAGEDIPLAGRICAVCDVYDALVSARPYKAAWAVEDALDEIRALSGSQFDPRLSWSSSSSSSPSSRHRRNWSIKHTSRSARWDPGGERGTRCAYRKGPRFRGPSP